MTKNSPTPDHRQQESPIARPLSRRRLLGSAATVTGAVGAATLLPPNVQKALAQPAPGPGSINEIKHIVLLMQENRSFDHYFGTLSGVRGFSDPGAMRLRSWPIRSILP